MKNDIDNLLKRRGIDALLVTGPAQHNPAMTYFTGVVHVTNADLIKIHGKPPILLHNPMEREEAAKTGIKCISYSMYPLSSLLNEANGDSTKAVALRYQKVLVDLGLDQGTVALSGQVDLGEGFTTFSVLQKLMPGINFIGINDDSILLEAMMTKDSLEVDKIRRMGKVTTEVVELIAAFLSSMEARNDLLIQPNGMNITIGEIKNRINLALAERNAENPEGTIFAIGRDAGIPHSSGNDSDPLRLGKTIVFDIFPCEAGGGYYYDFTRTWCLGFAPEPVKTLYDEVKEVYEEVVKGLIPGEPFQQVQKRTCKLFEKMGHPSHLNSPGTETGYVHSVGHGLGLHIHEKPFSGFSAPKNDCLIPGTVFTIEPGLYYPEKGMGVRLEDTYLTRDDGSFEKLAEFPMDLVIPIGT